MIFVVLPDHLASRLTRWAFNQNIAMPLLQLKDPLTQTMVSGAISPALAPSPEIRPSSEARPMRSQARKRLV